ncbi:helix-turn-helix domain-containing protein [Actinoplanes sp. ATCC 53533]|uniref:helix-turn-helix domain-containing protein n=1 Tax=Actinoplanes sp. ATCC 53533 TaxID=1288362 RepID=UPI000F7A4EF8|nr:helix-turn-helix domain-containing protein [Actinoplanes sp. ATCC 53533]
MPEQDPKGQPAVAAGPGQTLYYTVGQVAKMLGVSPRWLADRCRAEEVDHVYMARKRKFTPAQVEKVLKQYTVEGPDFEAERREQERIARRARARAAARRK